VELCLFNRESKLNVLSNIIAVGKCCPSAAMHGHIEKPLTTFTGCSYTTFLSSGTTTIGLFAFLTVEGLSSKLNYVD
jgi:hypothetical protein